MADFFPPLTEITSCTKLSRQRRKEITAKLKLTNPVRKLTKTSFPNSPKPILLVHKCILTSAGDFVAKRLSCIFFGSTRHRIPFSREGKRGIASNPNRN